MDSGFFGDTLELELGCQMLRIGKDYWNCYCEISSDDKFLVTSRKTSGTNTVKSKRVALAHPEWKTMMSNDKCERRMVLHSRIHSKTSKTPVWAVVISTGANGDWFNTSIRCGVRLAAARITTRDQLHRVVFRTCLKAAENLADGGREQEEGVRHAAYIIHKGE